MPTERHPKEAEEQEREWIDLESLLLDGLDRKGEATKLTTQWWEELRRELIARHNEEHPDGCRSSTSG